MNWKRIGRAALCLLVVCCLILNMSPLSARATAVVVPAVPVVAAVPGLNVVAAVLIGLGVLVGIAVTDWDTVLNNCAEWLEEQGVIDENGNCKIIKFPDHNGGLPKWFADVALIEMIRGWLFEQEVVTETAGQEGYAYYNGVELPALPVDSGQYRFIYNNGYGTIFLVCCDGYYLSLGSMVSTGASHQYKLTDGAWVKTSNQYDNGCSWSGSTLDRILWCNSDVKSYDGSTTYMVGSDVVPAGSSVDTAYDVSLGEFASSDTAIADGYTTWAENATTVTGSTIGGSDDEEIAVFPLGLGQTWEDTRELTQEDVWAGTSTYEDTSTDTDIGVITGTFADTAVGTFINNLIDALMTPFKWLADALLTGVKAIFVPSEDFLTAKVEALRSRYGFADSIMDTGKAIGAALNDFDASPPIIYMELANAESHYDWGGRAIALDLRWYERYKPTVDQLLSALLWIFFAWRVFRKLPGIISGMEGDAPFEPVSDGRLGSYVYNLPRIGSTSMKRRD